LIVFLTERTEKRTSTAAKQVSAAALAQTIGTHKTRAEIAGIAPAASGICFAVLSRIVSDIAKRRLIFGISGLHVTRDLKIPLCQSVENQK